MSLELVVRCPVCKGTTFRPFLVCKDYTTSGELFHVEQCTNCSMVLTNPRPGPEKASSYYQSKSYISHTSVAKSLFDRIYLIFRHLTLRWKYGLIKPFLNQAKLLDVGCGTGHFLSFCKKQGVEVYGVEPSPNARAKAMDIHVAESLEKLPDIKFNVITLWHVLEHIYDLELTFERLKVRLNDNGIIFIAVPNWQSLDAIHYKENWAAYDVPRHVWHFSKESMKSLIKNSGLRLIKITPMKLDSYYVSLLSERNSANGKMSLSKTIKAIMQGYQSNLKATTDMNYSSLIYFVQK